MPSENANGMLLAFRKISPSATWIQRIVAFATLGSHCHVECFFGTLSRCGSKLSCEKRCYTAFLFSSFSEYAVTGQNYNDRDWDLLFVPMTKPQLGIAREWIHRNLGVQYGYYDAITCPVSALHAPPVQHTKHNTLFCSQAMLCILQQSAVFPHSLQHIAPRHCSPEALFRLLTCENQCRRVWFRDCRIA
jgi:hypothetical protein